MTARIDITNRQARGLWLSAQGLAETPTGPLDVLAIIKRLGYVQLDTIQVVSRAHHHILWSRNQNYREPMLDRLLGRDRLVFEHFTHDASVLPMDFLPRWSRQFDRMADRVSRSSWYGDALDPDDCAAIKARIRAEGPLSTQAFDSQIKGPRQMWARPPHKKALDYMWYAGELATCHRVNFTKYYDLAERVFPKTPPVSEADQIDWLNTAAVARLGFANASEIKRFWDAVTPAEVKVWMADADLVPVRVQTASGDWVDAVAPPDLKARLDTLGPPTSRLRILNPFDPVVRDRDRMLRLFGFHYRVEMFVPAAKRKWGYYVYPLLEGDRFVGRIEVKADRPAGQLQVRQLWREAGVRWTAARANKLAGELARFAKLAGVGAVVWHCPDMPKG